MKMDNPSSNLNILSATLYGESEPNNYGDAEAIARVIHNRVAWPYEAWGMTHRATCLAPWQFSCWNGAIVNTKNKDAIRASNRLKDLFIDGDIFGSLKSNLPQWFYTCVTIASESIKKEPNLEGVTHYYANYAPMPKWARGLAPNYISPFSKMNGGKIQGHLFFALSPGGKVLKGDKLWQGEARTDKSQANINPVFASGCGFAAGVVASSILGAL